MPDRIYSFPPVVDHDSRILILGSMPGVRSLQAQQYYAHPQNHFWRIIFTLLNEPHSADYEDKINMLKKHRIALWDVLDSCERTGSSDAEIRSEEANEIRQLLSDYRNISAVFCNGQKSYKTLQKLLGKDFPKQIFLLPSTSPLHTIGFERKLDAWKIIESHL